MSEEKYIVMDLEHTFGQLVEECGEVLAAAGKTMRWGWDSYNPDLPPEQREKNIDWLLREVKDLKEAIARFEQVVYK